MSTQYLTFRDVRIKIEDVTEELTNVNKLFVTKQKLLDYGLCDETKLENYNNTDYVIDDDILPVENQEIDLYIKFNFLILMVI